MTMTIKTSDLIGPALDWAVANCEGIPSLHIVVKPSKNCVYGEVAGIDFPYQPSTDWAQGGPIIEREAITVRHMHNRATKQTKWQAEKKFSVQDGPTPLIAAMRCFVSSRLGDEVEIPDMPS